MSDLEKSLPFALVPVEVAFDSRLTLRHIRVLIALLACRNRSTNLIFPKRKVLEEMTGIRVSTISIVTTELVDLGWLEKRGNGGRSSPVNYRFIVPETITQALKDSRFKEETVLESSTVPELSTVPKLGTKTVLNLGTGKEQTREQRRIDSKNSYQEFNSVDSKKSLGAKTKTQKKTEFDFAEFSEQIPPDVMREFIQHRQTLKKPLTQHAFALSMREALKAGDIGMTPAEAINQTILAGWQGVNLAWLKNRQAKAEPDGRYRLTTEEIYAPF